MNKSEKANNIFIFLLPRPCFFYPQRWHLPFHTDADPTEACTDWAEWEGVQETDQAPTQVLDIADFMAMAIAQARPLP